MVEIVGAHRVRVQLEAGEVGHPRERRGVARHHFFGAAAGRKAQRHHLDPGRPRLRRALLEEELAVDAVRIAHQHVGPAARGAQRAVGHGEVVAHEVELGVARLAETAPCAGSRSRSPGPPTVSTSDSSLVGIGVILVWPRRTCCLLAVLPRPGRVESAGLRLPLVFSGNQLVVDGGCFEEPRGISWQTRVASRLRRGADPGCGHRRTERSMKHLSGRRRPCCSTP